MPSSAPPAIALVWWFVIAGTWVCYLPASFIAYIWAKAPVRRVRDSAALRLLESPIGAPSSAPPMRASISPNADLLHDVRSFAWPVAVATGVPFITLVVYLPFSRPWSGVILGHIWPDYLGMGDPAASTERISRIILWGFTGAFMYSFATVWRRFMALDITPNVYTYIGIRFLTSIITGGVVGAVVGASIASSVGAPLSERAEIPIYATVFVVGMFPDFGIAYLREVARKYMGKVVDSSLEMPLLRVAGINLWHESRFRQDGIENAHNLAATDIARLVRSFPFTVSQLIDWVDEAILITNTGGEQMTRLSAIGVRHASTVYRAVHDAERLHQLATASGIERNALLIVGLSLEASTNLPLILRVQEKLSAPPPVEHRESGVMERAS